MAMGAIISFTLILKLILGIFKIKTIIIGKMAILRACWNIPKILWVHRMLKIICRIEAVIWSQDVFLGAIIRELSKIRTIQIRIGLSMRIAKKRS